MESAFHLTRTYWNWWNKLFICFLSIALFRDFFYKWKLLLKSGEVNFLKTNHIPGGGHNFFKFFGIRKKQSWEKEFVLASGQLIFWLVEIFFLLFGETLASEILHFNQRKRIIWQVETVLFCLEAFPSIGNCQNHFPLFFQTARKMEENGSRKWKKILSTSQKISFH